MKNININIYDEFATVIFPPLLWYTIGWIINKIKNKKGEKLNMLENILEEQGEARRFTKEEEKKIRIYKKP